MRQAWLYSRSKNKTGSCVCLWHLQSGSGQYCVLASPSHPGDQCNYTHSSPEFTKLIIFRQYFKIFLYKSLQTLQQKNPKTNSVSMWLNEQWNVSFVRYPSIALKHAACKEAVSISDLLLPGFLQHALIIMTWFRHLHFPDSPAPKISEALGVSV